MEKKQLYPQRPLRATAIAFAALAALVATVSLYIPDKRLTPTEWPLLLGYCATLAFAGVGFARVRSRWVGLMGVAVLLAVLPALISAWRLLRGGLLAERLADVDIDNIMVGFTIAWYAICAVGVLYVGLVLWGWYSYFCDARERGAATNAC